MPVLPRLAARAAQAHPAASISEDSRILDARQLLRHAARATLGSIGRISKRKTGEIATPHIARRTAARLASTLWRRQNQCDQDCTGAIPTYYAGINAGPSPGAVVGIVLGSVAGFLLVLWLLFILSQGSAFIRTSSIEEDDVVVRRHHRSSGSHRSRRTEMRSRSPQQRRERIIRQERIVRDRTGPVGEVPAPRGPSRIATERIIVNEPERRVEGDDIVEVIEEHSSVDPAPRRKSRRSSGYRDSRSRN